MNNLAVIPARGGSKRIPHKNIKEFLGKPIIAYSIEAALRSGLFEEVMVSTDDEEIARVAKKYGAKVPFMRSKNNANDFATLAEVIAEVTESYKTYEKTFEFGCCILPTSPLIQISKLEISYKLLTSQRYDTIKPVVKFGYPIQRALKYEDSTLEMINPEFTLSRSQDLQPAYHDAGQFYWYKFVNGLKGTRKGAIILNEIEVQDIDNEEDWHMAELKYRILKSKKQL